MRVDFFQRRFRLHAGDGGKGRRPLRRAPRRRLGRRACFERLEHRTLLAADPIVGFGIAGDSLSDEYAGEVYSFASNWDELLAEQRGVNLGTVADWGEPRREGYEFNWARWGATSDTLLLDGQHTGLAQQVNDGLVSHAVLAIGQNDFVFTEPSYVGIYSGSWSQAVIDAYTDSVLSNIETALSTLTATDVHLVITNIIDFGVAPTTRLLYSDPVKRDRVANVIDGLNDRIETLADNYQVPLVDWFGFTKQLLGTNQAPVPSQTVGGQVFVNQAGVDPHNEFVIDGVHPHTISQALFANLFVEAFSLAYGTNLSEFTEAEMVGLVGLPYGGTDTLDITYSDFVILPTAGLDTPGLYDSATAGFHLKNSHAQGGGADVVFSYGPANAGWLPLVGDWDGDGTDTAGLYDPSTAAFHLKNSNVPGGGADAVFRFGPAGAGWQPLVGDFDGDGTDTVGLYDPATAGFHLKNTNSQGGGADVVFVYGPRGNRGWTALMGDFNNDGVDTAGLYDPKAAGFHLKNSNTTGGGADITPFSYGPANAGWRPLVGDWNADGTDTIGLYAPNNGGFYLKNTNANIPGSGADISFSYGPANSAWVPLTGDWNGPDALPSGTSGGKAIDLETAAAVAADRRYISEAFLLWDPAHGSTRDERSNGRRPSVAELDAVFALI